MTETSNIGGMAYVRYCGDLREALAELQHEIWSHWMKYLFSRCEPIGGCEPIGEWVDSPQVMPRDQVDRWLQQSRTHYSSLSEKERDSDREQADKILKLLHNPDLLPALQKLVLELQKANEPFDLQKELNRLRLESKTNMVVNETRFLWQVESIQDSTFMAKCVKIGDLDPVKQFDCVHVSEHDLQFFTVGAEFWSVSARESRCNGQHCFSERLIFVPPQKDKPRRPRYTRL